MKILSQRRRGLAGMTLMEVMVATVIFIMVMASLFMSFRTATKAYDVGMTHSEGSQAARYALTQIAEDLRNIYYLKYNSYNVTRRQREQLMAERERQAERSGSRLEDIDEQLPELGPKIDLSFMGVDNGETDELTFVRRQGEKRSEDRKMWGLARLRYFVAAGKLYRSVDDIRAPEVDEDGYEIPKPIPPQIDKISNNVVAFDLQFGYYFDEEWLLAPDWDSNATMYRNPLDEEEEDEDIISTSAAGGYTSGTEQMIPDDIPAWVELTLSYADPSNEERVKTYRQVVQLVSSQETYLPEDDTELEDNKFATRRRDRDRNSGYRSNDRESRRGMR